VVSRPKITKSAPIFGYSIASGIAQRAEEAVQHLLKQLAPHALAVFVLDGREGVLDD